MPPIGKYLFGLHLAADTWHGKLKCSAFLFPGGKVDKRVLSTSENLAQIYRYITKSFNKITVVLKHSYSLGNKQLIALGNKAEVILGLALVSVFLFSS